MPEPEFEISAASLRELSRDQMIAEVRKAIDETDPTLKSAHYAEAAILSRINIKALTPSADRITDQQRPIAMSLANQMKENEVFVGPDGHAASWTIRLNDLPGSPSCKDIFSVLGIFAEDLERPSEGGRYVDQGVYITKPIMEFTGEGDPLGKVDVEVHANVRGKFDPSIIKEESDLKVVLTPIAIARPGIV